MTGSPSRANFASLILYPPSDTGNCTMFDFEIVATVGPFTVYRDDDTACLVRGSLDTGEIMDVVPARHTTMLVHGLTMGRAA